MDIYEALNNITWKKKEYFLWKHDLYVLKEKPSEEELCKTIQSKSIAYMLKWEKTPEYLNLVNILIESKTGKDLEDIYTVVRKKALEGDEKSIKLLMDIQKQAKAFNRTANKVETKKVDYDELELDI